MMRTVSLPLSCLLFLCLSGISLASDADLQSALNQQWKGKVLFLRHPAQSDSVKFDSVNNLITQDTGGPWTLYGGFVVESVYVQPQGVRVQGYRIFVQKDVASGKLVTYRFKRIKDLKKLKLAESIQLEIHVDQSPQSTDEVRKLLAGIVCLNKADFLDSVPVYWRGYLAVFLEYEPELHPIEFNLETMTPNVRESGQPGSTKVSDTGEQIRRCCKKDVKPPKPFSTPKPGFSDAARYSRLTGSGKLDIIVDNKGEVRAPVIVRALGLGLDENEVNTIATWRFDPATLDGHPVAIQMQIEVDFQLH
jgi:hypothetical protein